MKINRNELLSLVVPTNVKLFGVNFTQLCNVVLSESLSNSGFVYEEIDWNIAEDRNWIYMFSAWENGKFKHVIKIGETKGSLLIPAKTSIGREYTSYPQTRLARYTHDLHTSTVVNVSRIIKEQLDQGFEVRCHVVKPDDAFKVLFKDPLGKLSKDNQGEQVIYRRSWSYSNAREFDVRTEEGKRIACEAQLLVRHFLENNGRPLANKNDC
jgi:hypothetical protein